MPGSYRDERNGKRCMQSSPCSVPERQPFLKKGCHSQKQQQAPGTNAGDDSRGRCGDHGPKRLFWADTRFEILWKHDQKRMCQNESGRDVPGNYMESHNFSCLQLTQQTRIAPGRIQLCQHLEKRQDGQDPYDLFQECTAGNIPNKVQQKRYTEKKRCPSQRKIPCLFVHAQPHETMTGIDLSGVMVIASTGQYIRQR